MAPGALRAEQRKRLEGGTIELEDFHQFTCFQCRASLVLELCLEFYIFYGSAFPKVNSPPLTVEREVRQAGEGDFRLKLLPAQTPSACPELPALPCPALTGPGSSNTAVCLGFCAGSGHSTSVHFCRHVGLFSILCQVGLHMYIYFLNFRIVVDSQKSCEYCREFLCTLYPVSSLINILGHLDIFVMTNEPIMMLYY